MNLPQTPGYVRSDSYRWINEILERARVLSGQRFCLWDEGLSNWLLHEDSKLVTTARKIAVSKALRLHVRSQLRKASSKQVVEEIRKNRIQYFISAAKTTDPSPGVPVVRLFSDLFSQRTVDDAFFDLQAEDLARRANWLILKSKLAACKSVSIRALGNTRNLIHIARIRGLITSIKAYDSATSRLMMEISGPISIFHRTVVYANALNHLVLGMGSLMDFEIRIRIETRDSQQEFLVTPADPIEWPAVKCHFDSHLEKKFFVDFVKLAPEWELTREPSAIPVQEELFFPDFAIRNRLTEGPGWLLEIVGFWHPEYLRSKLQKIRSVNSPNFIIAVDQTLKVDRQQFADDSNIVWFKRKLKAQDIIQKIKDLSEMRRSSDSYAASS